MTAPDQPTATPFNRDTDPRTDRDADPRAGREPMPHEAVSQDPHAGRPADARTGAPPDAGGAFPGQNPGGPGGPNPGGPNFGGPGGPGGPNPGADLGHDMPGTAGPGPTRNPEATTGPVGQAPMTGGPRTPTAGEPTPGAGRPGGEGAITDRPAGDNDDDNLFHGGDLAGMRKRWDDVQAAFVDDPRECVQKADALVSEVVDQLTRQFSDARSRLEGQWSRGEQVSTEDLRVALKRYREFFQRLLSV